MRKIRITVMRVARYDDLIRQYENPIEHACSMREGQVFIANGTERPDGFCESAWEIILPFAAALAAGGSYMAYPSRTADGERWFTGTGRAATVKEA